MTAAFAPYSTPDMPRFTPREIEVMSWTAQGKTRGEISIILSISEATVKTHLERACRKLNAVNKTQAVALALSHGVIALPRMSLGIWREAVA